MRSARPFEFHARAGIAMWCNALDGVTCGGFSDRAALERPDAIWGGLLGAGVSVVQTDFAGRMREWLAGEGRVAG